MSGQGQSRVVQAHEAIYASLHPDGKGVKTARDQLTMQQLDTSADPLVSYCLPLYTAFAIGFDIKPERQVIQINFASIWFLLNAVRAIETGGPINSTGMPHSGSVAPIFT